MAGSEWGIYERHLVEVNLNGLSYWLTGIFAFLRVTLRNYRERKNEVRIVYQGFNYSLEGSSKSLKQFLSKLI